MIEWTKIDPDNLPQGEVIAYNHAETSMVGELYMVEEIVVCTDNSLSADMYYITHYSLINKPNP